MTEPGLKVLFAASEVYPLASTGGLASVVAELPAALKEQGLDARVMIPFYGDLEPGLEIRWIGPGRTFLGEAFGIGETRLPNGVTVYLVARDEEFSRKGIYGPDPDSSWPDNPRRFAFFCRAAEASPPVTGFDPQIHHCHDWPTGLLPVYLDMGGRPSVFTIHNMAYQGRFGRESWPGAGLPDRYYSPGHLEFWGDWNMMKGALVHSSAFTTVSPGYAREIRTPGFGFGLETVIEERIRKFSGILNGIDPSCWNPRDDPALPAGYGTGAMEGKRRCRRELLKDFGLDDRGGPVVGMVTRLTAQKGVDLVLDSLPLLTERGMTLAVLGTGESGLERAFKNAADRRPGSVGVRIEYCDRLARRVFAGSDVFLMPSRFEPCGISQMIAMRYGSVPLVRKTGGLADTVSEETGFLFESRDDFPGALDAAAALWSHGPARWAVKRRLCMKADNSWSNRVPRYLEVYLRVLSGRRA